MFNQCLFVWTIEWSSIYNYKILFANISLKMKLFETLKNQLVRLGIDPNQNESNLFNRKITMAFILFGLNILSSVTSILSMEDINRGDFVEIAILFTAFIQMTICLLTIVLQQSKLFAIMGSIEELVNKRKPPLFTINLSIEILGEKKSLKWKTKLEILGLKCATSKKLPYEDTNQLVEKISGILDVVFVKVLPQCMIWPQFVFSFVEYFTADSNAYVFDVLFPWW